MPQVVEAALRHLATRLLAEGAETLTRAGGGKLVTEGPAFNNNTVAMVRWGDTAPPSLCLSTQNNTIRYLNRGRDLVYASAITHSSSPSAAVVFL